MLGREDIAETEKKLISILQFDTVYLARMYVVELRACEAALRCQNGQGSRLDNPVANHKRGA